MGHWNYRVVHHKASEHDSEWWGLHEVYYNEDGAIWAIMEEPEIISTEGKEGIIQIARMMFVDACKDNANLEADMPLADMDGSPCT